MLFVEAYSLPGRGVSAWCVWLLFCIQSKPWNLVAFRGQPKVDYAFPSKPAHFSLFERVRDKTGARSRGNHQRDGQGARAEEEEWKIEIVGKGTCYASAASGVGKCVFNLRPCVELSAFPTTHFPADDSLVAEVRSCWGRFAFL